MKEHCSAIPCASQYCFLPGSNRWVPLELASRLVLTGEYQRTDFLWPASLSSVKGVFENGSSKNEKTPRSEGF